MPILLAVLLQSGLNAHHHPVWLTGNHDRCAGFIWCRDRWVAEWSSKLDDDDDDGILPHDMICYYKEKEKGVGMQNASNYLPWMFDIYLVQVALVGCFWF